MVMEEAVIPQLVVRNVGAGLGCVGDVGVPRLLPPRHRNGPGMVRKLEAGGTDGICKTLIHKFP